MNTKLDEIIGTVRNTDRYILRSRLEDLKSRLINNENLQYILVFNHNSTSEYDNNISKNTDTINLQDWISTLTVYNTRIVKEVVGRELAHEISNPLTAIIINIDYLKDIIDDFKGDEDLTGVLEAIKNSSTRIKSLMENIREKQVEEMDSVQVSLIASLVNQLINSNEQNTILFTINYDTDKPINGPKVVILLYMINNIQYFCSKNSFYITLYLNNKIKYIIEIGDKDLYKQIKEIKPDESFFSKSHSDFSFFLQILSKKVPNYDGTFEYSLDEENEMISIHIEFPLD